MIQLRYHLNLTNGTIVEMDDDVDSNVLHKDARKPETRPFAVVPTQSAETAK